MDSRHPIRAHWGLLVPVYWAVLIPTALVVLTSQTNVVPFLALLLIGIPIYFVAANTLVNRCESSEASSSGDATCLEDEKIAPFPGYQAGGGQQEVTPAGPGRSLHKLE
jgi:hypothetical protein